MAARMAARKETGSPRRANGPRKAAVDVDDPAVRAVEKLPLAEPFYMSIDHQLKSGYATYSEAEKAALEIKRRYPRLAVSVYDAKQQRHTTVELAKA